MPLVLIVVAHIGESLIRSLGLHKENHIEVEYRYLEGVVRYITLWVWGSGKLVVLGKAWEKTSLSQDRVTPNLPRG